MRRIHCLNNISPLGTALLTEGYALSDTLEGADGALVRSASLHDVELPESLLAIARAGAGVNNIPLERCAEAGIVVFNTPGANANAVKELVICALLLAAAISRAASRGAATTPATRTSPKRPRRRRRRFPGARSRARGSA